LYRGEHHPTDVLGSLVFSALWLTATSLLIKPNTGRQSTSRPVLTTALAETVSRQRSLGCHLMGS
jgi:membrane-associated phospholipid phosphatase